MSSPFLWNLVMVTSAIANIAIGWSLWEATQDQPSPSLGVLSHIIPAWLWPALFGAVGLFAIGGFVSTTFGRVQFYLGALLMFLWGAAALSLWLDDGPQIGGIFLIHLATLKLICAVYSDRLRRVHRATERLQHEVSEAQDEMDADVHSR